MRRSGLAAWRRTTPRLTMTLTLIPLPDTEPQRPRRPARERKRRYRQRQAAGRMAVTVEIDGAVLDLLIACEWIGEREAADRRQVGEAVGRLLAASAARR